MSNEKAKGQEPRIYRFTNYPAFGYWVDTIEHDVSGPYVKLSDYRALKAQLDLAMASIKSMANICNICKSNTSSKPGQMVNIVV